MICNSNIMKCIYCNSEVELTSSDIITYAVTGAKLTKSFVCKTHNAFTNDTYEKKFIADLDFFRNHLGLTTRDGKPIQYRAGLLVDGAEVHNVKISNRESLYAPKDVVVGTDDNGNKIIMAPMDRIEIISKGKATPIDLNDIVVHKIIEADSFLGFHAVHSIAKMAYEWYCYVNDIEEFKEKHSDIVNYILGNKDGDFVDVIVDCQYYSGMDVLSEIGTNTFFQYDDVDGYRYVVVDFWKTISYRVRICKSPDECFDDGCSLFFKLYLYHIDGSKTQTEFAALCLDGSIKPKFNTIQLQNITVDIWRSFVKRIEKIMSTMVLSVYTLKREVDEITSKLKKYDVGKMDLARLLGFEENNIVATIEVICQIHLNKDKYDMTKSFNHNLPIVLNLDSNTIERTQEDKMDFLNFLVAMDREDKLSEYVWNGINTFNEIYENEMKLNS